jgi:hypothetical protein
MLRSLYIKAERGEALARLIGEDGQTPAGEVPADHAAALREVERPGEATRVADAHAEGRGPPSFAGAPDDAGPPEDVGGQGQGGGPP